MKTTKKNQRKRTLTRTLSQASPSWLIVAVICGMVSGLCFAFVIPFIIYSLSGSYLPKAATLESTNYSFFNSPTSTLATIFVLNCFCILIFKSLSMIMVNLLSKKAAFDLKMELYEKVRHMPTSSIERVGPSVIINVFTRDIPTLAGAVSILPNLWVSAVTTIGLLSYLLSLDYKVFIFVLICIIIGGISYQIPLQFGVYLMQRVRKIHDVIQEGVRGFIYGSKELKLNTQKCEEYLKETILEPERSALQKEKLGTAIMLMSISYGDLIAFGVMGVVAFHLPYIYSLNNTELLGIIMALLYITGPIAVFLNSLPQLKAGHIALEHITKLEAESIEEPGSTEAIPDWNQLVLRDISYSYPADKSGAQFKLKPINLTFEKGQISYIVGGNGSGKSTLAKLITQHYPPSIGTIYFGNTAVTMSNKITARESICAIYSDFYTFPKLYGMLENLDVAEMQRYLKYLELDQKIKIDDKGVFSRVELSDGQRRRLALLVTLLEDRDVYLFDEWAADQDPRFKDIFYTKILPDLKSKNKMVIIITHDDRYFKHADQLIFMEDGRVADTQINESPSTEEQSILNKAAS